MSYLFDLEDFGTYCRTYYDAIIKQALSEVKQNREEYYQANNTYNGYVPKQETVFLNSDGSISIYFYNRDLGIKTLFDFGQYCCVNNMGWIITKLKEVGLFPNIDVKTTTFSWDNDNQSCRWKPIVENCDVIDIKKIVLNPVDDDGALFNVESGDKTCNLSIEFSYLFKYDCDTLSSLLVKPNTDPKVLEQIKKLESLLAETKTKCESISDNIFSLTQEFNNSFYSLENNNKYYCINEENGGLSQLQALLGPLKYNKFINGEPNSYTTDDFAQFMNLNNQSINEYNKELMFECNTPYGFKTNLKADISKLTQEQLKCDEEVIKIQNQLNTLQSTTVTSVECSIPINALETFDASVTLDVIESDGSLTTVSEFDLFPAIGIGNLYTYLTEKQENSGFYFCSLPKPTETWTSGCTSLIAYELTNPQTTPNKEPNLNVATCNTVKDSLLSSLLSESPFSNSPSDIAVFNQSLNKNVFASNWLTFNTIVDDESIINLIKNKKIKISIKINNSCSNVCIYIDNIKLIKECVDGNGKKVTVNKSPGFELERVIDNKKSWINNTTRVNRDFDIENINNLTVIRKTDYDVNDERLVINTKEIDLNINIASAIENDVQCFINDNPNLLETVPSNDCGCDLLECYEDVFKIIPYAEAVDSGIIENPIEPEDLMTSARAVRDAWLKALNELTLATGPYLDIQNGVYHPNPSEDVMGTYNATRNAWRKALNEFNLASGGGFIEGLTVEGQFNDSNESQAYVNETYNNYELVAPQMFKTKCGRIFKRNNGDGYIYFVETPTKELKVFWAFEDFGDRDKVWIDISSLVQEDYAANWDYATISNDTPEKASFYCKFMMPNNYTTWAQMMYFRYITNGNSAHNEYINPVEDSFFIDWDDKKGKCMTNMFNQVIPEQFSMPYPITSINQWTNYTSGMSPIENPQCTLDVYLRNSATTACTSVDFTWPNVAGDIDTVYRAYRDRTLKLANQTKLTENTPTFNIYIIDPATNMVPDETSGYIPVKVTTTIRKGSRDGEVVFKEEYLLNDPSYTCYQEMYGPNGLNDLTVYVGITDPNSAYMNPNASIWDFSGCASYGTLLSGSTSNLPLAGASDNATDRNWRFDEDYYVHFDVVNNNNGYVYEVTNNDFNLKDRTLPIVCPTSASTQTFDINSALNTINTHKLKMLSNIQEDLDWALEVCSCDLETPPAYTELRRLDFMDDLSRMPSFENLVALPYTSGTVDYSSSATLYGKASEYTNLDYLDDYSSDNLNLWDLEHQIITGVTVGFSSSSYPALDYTNLLDVNFDSNKLGNYVKGKIKRIKNLWWRKASTYPEWTGSTYPLHSMTLDVMLPNVDDFKYLKAVANISYLPSDGNAGELILVGTPSSYVGYAWDPILNTWSTDLYDFIFTEILEQRFVQRDARVKSKLELLLATKPFLWSNEFIPAHGLKQWMYGDAKNFDPSTTTGDDVIYNYNNNLPLGLPPEYTVTATTHTIPSYTGNSNNIIY